jgi:hypothetical protein
MKWLEFIIPAASVLLGYALGFWQGWTAGKKWGEADGVRWARKRLEEMNDRVRRARGLSE